MIPSIYKFPDAYQNDGLEEIVLTFTNGADSTIIDLSGNVVNFNLIPQGELFPAWKFSTEDGSIVFTANGSVKIVRILSWNIPGGMYLYDMQVIDNTGFVNTYLRGRWNIVPDITKTP